MNILLSLFLSVLVVQNRTLLLSFRSQAKASSAEIENRIIAIVSELRYPSSSSNDYLPVRGSGAVIDPDVLESPVSSKNSDLFDPEFYIYRTFLPENGKQIYDQIYENAVSCNTSRFTLVVPVSESILADAVTAVYNDHPELFWLDTAYSFGYLPNGEVVSVTLAYNETIQNLSSYQWAFGHATASALSAAASMPSDIEKEKAVHDYLLSHSVYDPDSQMNQSAYSALVLGSSVCAGYCRAFQYLLQSLNIPCYYCTGTAYGGGHAWNIVRIDGEYYNVDPSWNDTSLISYTYFNVPDSAFSAEHTRTGLSVSLPSCTSERTPSLAVFENLYSGLSSLPTYQSLGFEPGDVLASLSDYSRVCRDFLIRSGIGTHELSVILINKQLLDQVMQQIQDQTFVQDYALEAAESLHLASSTISITLHSEPLSGGYILLRQSMTLTRTSP